jgi:hypothetical protein
LNFADTLILVNIGNCKKTEMRINMKKLQAALLTGLTICVLAGCGKSNNTDMDSSIGSTETTAESTIESIADTNVGTAEGTPASGGADTEASEGWSDEMQQLKDKIVEAIGDEYWPNMALEPDMLESLVGLTGDMYDDYLAEMPMISTNVDTLLIVKTKNGNVEEVEQVLEDYREALVNDTMQYPMNLGKIQASRIERVGDYVCFVQLGGSAVDLVEQGDEAVIEQCREQNELVLEVIRNNITD